ncbi:hypothetical protein [Buchananella hordeovulneris]|uniref:Uncharacterized protein n=1 Tax=Buchananella hordeovulneris TaxID=52770 RepID=A0A1Q5PTN6_9ACTO|nr:hypothetical protein [Buchananella hordeovulneris]OKL50924.1 hypothetical protein BSZ40_09810 [Buchananella hordeovulneris]RRD44129.1 hypothetical protein EII13_05325 [Buchananella hordeovulneris]
MITEKNLDIWALPTDPYIGWREGILETHAYGLLVDQCMERHNFPQYQRGWDAFAPRADFLSPSGQQLFNERTAAQYGYRLGEEPGDLVWAERQARSQGEDPDAQYGQIYADQLLVCEDEATRIIHPDIDQWEDAPTTPTQKTISELDKLAVDLTAADLQAAAAAWRECMAPLGIADLPERPWPMSWPRIPASLRTAWNWETTSTASAAEIEVALHDAQCRTSSGWQQTLYDQQWALHADFVTSHAEELRAVLDEIEAREQRLLALIRDHSTP